MRIQLTNTLKSYLLILHILQFAMTQGSTRFARVFTSIGSFVASLQLVRNIEAFGARGTPESQGQAISQGDMEEKPNSVSPSILLSLSYMMLGFHFLLINFALWHEIYIVNCVEVLFSRLL